jgi:hypothetical protein
LQQHPDRTSQLLVFSEYPVSQLHLLLRRQGIPLGTLHLHRVPFQARYAADDLLRADAFAAHVGPALPPPNSAVYRRDEAGTAAAPLTTEACWRASSNPDALLRFLGGSLGARQRSCFLLACVHRAWHLVTDRPCRRAVQILGCYLDGLASDGDRAAAWQAAHHFCAQHAPGNASQVAADICAPDANPASLANRLCHELALAAAPPQLQPLILLHGGVAHIAGHWRVVHAERAAQADLVREVVGNPFRPVAVDPAWLAWNDGTAARLARRIYNDRAFEDLPILADALEEAGCAAEELLRHLRTGSGHVVGCWALDALLGHA